MRLPHVTDLAGVDAAVYGIPFDTAVTFRPGARFGPEAIRSASALLRPFHSGFGIDVCDALSIVDYGDLPVAPGDTEGTYRRVEEALAPVVEAGVVPARARRRPLDHAGRAARDRQAARPARARPARCARRHVGRVLRPALLPRDDVPARGRGGADRPGGVRTGGHARAALPGLGPRRRRARSASRSFRARSSATLGPAAYGELVRERVGDRPVFLSFDVDFLDPAYAPGTGTPEVAGFSTAEAIAFLRSLRGSRSPARTWSRCRRPTTARARPRRSPLRTSPGSCSRCGRPIARPYEEDA